MFAISFDLKVMETRKRHPKEVPQAYSDISRALRPFGFDRVQGSVYLTNNDDIGNLMLAILALKALPWMADCVRDIRGFKVENWSDFTPILKA